MDESNVSHRKRFILVLFQSGSRHDSLGSLDRLVLHRVQGELHKIDCPPADVIIDLWIESPGGDASVAYKLVLALRQKCSLLRAVVPDYAKSAATLVALGCDELFFAIAAEVGPLDAQIQHPDKEGVRVSALDVANALSWLADFAVQYTIAGGYDVLEWTQLPRADVLREFSLFAANLLKPIVGKLDPHTIHQATNELKLAQKYAERLISGRRTKEDDLPVNPGEIAKHLVQHYPAHEYVICRDELSDEIGIPVEHAESYDLWGPIQLMHRIYRESLFSSTGPPHSRIKLYTEQELMEEFTALVEGHETPGESAQDGQGAEEEGSDDYED